MELHRAHTDALQGSGGFLLNTIMYVYKMPSGMHVMYTHFLTSLPAEVFGVHVIDILIPMIGIWTETFIF